MLTRYERILAVVKVETDCRRGEKLHEVPKADEENAVLPVLAVHLLTRMHGPFGGLVPPGTFPLDTTVRVADLDKPFRVGAFLVQEYRFGPNQCVSVIVDEASLLDSGRVDFLVLRRVNAATHCKAFLVSHLNLLPEILHISHLRVNKAARWTASQRVERLSSHSSLYPLVTPKDLRPSFLEDENPDLIDVVLGLRRLREGPLATLLIEWKVVVDHNCASLTIYIHLNGVTACIIDFLSQKDPFDAIRILCQCRKRCQEVTVTALALGNVVRARTIIYNIVVTAIYLIWSLPSEVSPLLVAACRLNGLV